jgi:hypothetical protein
MNMRPLNSEEAAARDAGLELAARLVGFPPPLSMADVQTLYDVLLDVSDPPAEALIAAGLAFGEQIIAASDFEWMRVSDEFGDETCVAAPKNEIFCSPISMIQKRIEQKEGWDLVGLRDDTIAIIRKRIEEGKARDR